MPLLKKPLLVAAALAMGIAAAHAGDIGPGSPAPALDVKTWYKGTPVKSFDADKIYVVEFWATWCGPCRESIPHLSELAKKNKDVTFIGVSIWEDDNGTNVKQFVEQMGDKMDYNVGYSGNQTGMAASWMTPAAQNGIPAAFIVKNGQIQWIGHPMEMEKPLSQVKDGTFDLAAFKAGFDKTAAATRQQIAARAEMKSANDLINAGKFADAKAKIGEIEQKFPLVKDQLDGLNLSLLAKSDAKAWDAKVKDLAKRGTEQSTQTLVNFAMSQTLPNGNVEQGKKTIEYIVANAKGDSALPYYYAALFYSQSKDYKSASKMVDQALSVLPKDARLKDNKQAKDVFEKMKTDIEAKAKAGSN